MGWAWWVWFISDIKSIYLDVHAFCLLRYGRPHAVRCKICACTLSCGLPRLQAASFAEWDRSEKDRAKKRMGFSGTQSSPRVTIPISPESLTHLPTFITMGDFRKSLTEMPPVVRYTGGGGRSLPTTAGWQLTLWIFWILLAPLLPQTVPGLRSSFFDRNSSSPHCFHYVAAPCGPPMRGVVGQCVGKEKPPDRTMTSGR